MNTNGFPLAPSNLSQSITIGNKNLVDAVTTISNNAGGMTIGGTGHWETHNSVYSPKPRGTKDIDVFIDSVTKSLSRVTIEKEVLERTLEKLQSFSFKEGDVVISKTQGNGIIVGIGVGENSPGTLPDGDFADRLYVTLATKNGYIRVDPDDIMPYTVASKVLYEK